MDSNKVGYVVSSAADSITVRIDSLHQFEKHKSSLQVGRYLRISEGNSDFVIAAIRNVQGTTTAVPGGEPTWSFDLACEPVGTLQAGLAFVRGSTLLPVPTEPAFAVDQGTLEKIFAAGGKFNRPLAPLSMNKNINLMIDADGFFGKHLAVVGSTGSGKSCAVAQMLHDAIGIAANANKNVSAQRNAHVIIFDFHAEYRRAFTLAPAEKFSLNVLDVATLALPYWLMNSEELESLFIESNEANSHNQVSQFKRAVIANKEKHNPGVPRMTYDCPVYFSIEEVYRYIDNVNREVIGRLKDENVPKLSDGTLVRDRRDHYFEKALEFADTSTAAATKATNGPFNGEFHRFASRLQTTLSDKRLDFLLRPQKGGVDLKTPDFSHVVQQFLGYLTRANVTILDLSGVPFEVMSITVSLVARLAFDFSYHYSKLRQANAALNDVPIMLVCEEAHNYVPRSDSAAYRSSRKSIERIAKEGRKYGLSLMIVSQRPAEVSDTIFAQCSNFIALRLTNGDDQAYIRHLLPSNARGVTDTLPNLSQGECVVVGDAVLMPAVIQMPRPKPEPQSDSIATFREWQELWKQVEFDAVVQRWQRDSTR